MIRRILAQFIVLGVGATALIGLGGVSNMLAKPGPADSAVVIDTTSALATMQGELADTRKELERAHQVLEFSGRYDIPADLAAQVYDTAIEEGISPSLGFQLVKIESGFKNAAASGMAALGLTQLRLPTARIYDASVTASDLLNADVSLHLGFRYLRDLLKRFDQDVELALEAYNKGPTLVSSLQDEGTDVRGRYSRTILGGVRKQP